MSREALVLLVCCCDFRDGAERLIPSKSLRNAVIWAFPGLFRILRMCAPRRAAAVVRPRGREKSADRRRRILISRLLIIRASVPRRKSPFPAYFKGFPAVSPLIPPYPAFLKYPVSPQKRILIVEDEPDIQELLRTYLEDAGYRTAVAGDGVAALSLFHARPFDLILLDLMLPKIDGFGVCELIRQQSQVPIIMLTALDGEDQQLKGFGMDIDDYVTKPFSMPVLLEKIRVILRRRGSADEESRLRYRDLSLDLDTREAMLEERPLDLTAREFELLHTFLAAPGRVFTREMLLAKLWGYDFYGDERVVDSHIKNLRHKLGRDYIETVRGVGYRAAKEDL